MSSYPEALEAREAAARGPRERIERDLEDAPIRVAKMLRHLRERMFDPDLNVEALKRACGLRDNSVATEFHSAVGLPPRAYLEALRLETAAELLRGTELRVWQVSELVGYAQARAFRRAFRKRWGVGPGGWWKGTLALAR